MAWNRPRKPWNTKWGMFSRRRTTRKIPMAAIPKGIARTRSEWLTVYNPMSNCVAVSAPWDGAEPCQPLHFSFGIIDPSRLSDDAFNDDIKIVGMKGFFAFRPLFQRPEKCSEVQLRVWRASVRDTNVFGRFGLYKQATTEDTPFGITPHLDESDDWSDTRLIREWHREWMAQPYQLHAAAHPRGSFLGICSEVTRASYITPATATGDQPAFQVPEIETDCEAQYVDTEIEECPDGPVYEVNRELGWKRISLDSRKTIRLRESDRLDLECAFTKVGMDSESTRCGYSPAVQPCGVQIIPVLKLRMQWG